MTGDGERLGDVSEETLIDSLIRTIAFSRYLATVPIFTRHSCASRNPYSR
jgi:hypothetical protein